MCQHHFIINGLEAILTCIDINTMAPEEPVYIALLSVPLLYVYNTTLNKDYSILLYST